MKGQTRGNNHKEGQGKLWWSIRKNILHCEGSGTGAREVVDSPFLGRCEQRDPALKLSLP